jgi:hypothetical protein
MGVGECRVEVYGYTPIDYGRTQERQKVIDILEFPITLPQTANARTLASAGICNSS